VSDEQTFVIVGAGLAGAKAAETLRAESFRGRVVLIGAEPELPYERPPLSKSYLAGETPLGDARVHDADYYAEQSIELLTGNAATALDTVARRVELADGSALAYDKLLIATGAVPRRPPIEGAELDGVLLLRTASDADALREAIDRPGRLIVIGAGWIGSEVAATARGRGSEVTVIEQSHVPLERVLGPQLGEYFARLHRSHGVELLTGTGVARIDGDSRATGVTLTDGRAVEGDAVLLAVGVGPATDLAVAGGLEIDDGIVADARLRTSAPDVFAAGDVASAQHPRYGRRVRVEHWANAADQGAFAAQSMLGSAEEYSKVPYFFSDQYDMGMEYFGLHGAGDELVVRGSLDDDSFQVLWTAPDGTVTAAMHVNDWDASDAIRASVDGAVITR
jgi:3-phenylpropionate/trans-cinnamate dioxygenase ferredoxin reductase subunit